MSGFVALNVEPEEYLEEDVDDTKEIQLEEAFKLYQNALKLHSQGPTYFTEASDAYQELFTSEVFKYPEAISDYLHELSEDTTIVTAPATATAPLPVLTASAAEAAANSVPQLAYLSYKSRGQFALDLARAKAPKSFAERRDACHYYAESCRSGLLDFANALERDDSDLDLWKKAARVADVLKSYRIARFCLESVIAGDDETTGDQIDLSGLDEVLAASDLKDLVKALLDDLSVANAADIAPRTRLIAALRKTNDAYSFLPPRSEHLFGLVDTQTLPGPESTQHVIFLDELTSEAITNELLEVISDIKTAESGIRPYTVIKIDLAGNTGILSTRSDKVKSNTPTILDMDTAGDGFANAQSPEKSPAYADALSEQAADEPHSPLHETEPATPPADAPDEITTVTAADEEISTDPPAEEHSIDLPTRKRSSTVAGIEEPEGRKQSKRIRARESMVGAAALEEDALHEPQQFYLDQLAEYDSVDQTVSDLLASLLPRLDITNSHRFALLKSLFWQESPDSDHNGPELTDKSLQRALLDLRDILANWSDAKTQAFIHGHGIQDPVEKSTGMTLFLQHSKHALARRRQSSSIQQETQLLPFVEWVNTRALDIYMVSLHWIRSLLTSNSDLSDSTSSTPYLQQTWSEDLKSGIMDILKLNDDTYVEMLQQHHIALRDNMPRLDSTIPQASVLGLTSFSELVQGIFELHLDHYIAITGPTSDTDAASRLQQKDRLARWADLANDFFHLHLQTLDTTMTDNVLVTRHLWATTFYAMYADDVDKQHKLLCLQELSSFLEETRVKVIPLPNNTAMPEISVNALEQEVIRLNTLDFFLSVFDSDSIDPVEMIEKLEPVLEPVDAETTDAIMSDAIPTSLATQTQNLVEFLQSGDACLKLFLWRRLQNAYTAISYSPKVVSCMLRSIETIVDEIRTDRHERADHSERQISLLKWLRDIDEMLTKVLVKVTNDENPFEYIDGHHLATTIKAVSFLIQLLYGFQIYDDSLRVGQTPPPQLKGSLAVKAFEKSKDRFREMLVRLWTLQYALMKEARAQRENAVALSDLADYLRHVHRMLGVRHYCKHGNKLFIRLVKTELASLGMVGKYSHEISQVYYDLYHLRFSPGQADEDHGCPTETLDKKTAISLIPPLMAHVSGLNVKDLGKSDLKATIERIHNASGAVKSSGTNLTFNKKLISSFLKSPVNLDDVLRCVRGVGYLSIRPVPAENKVVADSGWYYLMGFLTLNKYRSVKRVNPTPTDDLDVAAQFLRQDLEHDVEKWESWYRLAQVFECKIEDDLIWNSTKLNDNRGDIAQLERSAIHAYTMAIAVAMRTAEDNQETTKKIHDMFAEFATRLYSSSRPPLDMEAFVTERQMRLLSDPVTAVLTKVPFHQPIQLYQLWNFAAYLLRQNIGNHPRSWLNLYTLGKILWKMFKHPNNLRVKRPVTADDVLSAFSDSIEALPRKERSTEYILEPHFKITSIVHKMVQRQDVTPRQAVGYLAATKYAQTVHLSEDESGSEPEWEPYILAILSKLGHADKSNWHHRIGARAAHVIWESDPGTLSAALGAKHEFTQQIFTKTMTLQVWKPEFERPGRHYVYTGRYVLFFAELLQITGDRAGLDQLIRRIRRKPTDFLNHPKIWEEVVTRYVALLRRLGSFPQGRERPLFDPMSHDEFSKNADKLEKWAHDPQTDSKVLGVMRDAVELKKLNNSLMKGTLIDDLVGDAYAFLFETFVATQTPEKEPSPPPQPTQADQTEPQQPPIVQSFGGQDGLDRMRMGNLLSSNDVTDIRESPAPPSIGLGVQTPQHQTSQSTMEPAANPTPTKPGRTKTVTRREIQRKAESALIKPPPIKTPTLGKKPIIELPSARKDSMASVDDENEQSGTVHDRDRVNSRTIRDGHEQDSRVSSRRASLQAEGEMDLEGDADDESELSELDEDSGLIGRDSTRNANRNKNAKTMFAGLADRRSRDGASEASETSKRDGDEANQSEQDNENDDENLDEDVMEVDVDENVDGSGDEDDGEDADEMDIPGPDPTSTKANVPTGLDSEVGFINDDDEDLEIPDSQSSPEVRRKK